MFIFCINLYGLYLWELSLLGGALSCCIKLEFRVLSDSSNILFCTPQGQFYLLLYLSLYSAESNTKKMPCICLFNAEEVNIL